MTMSNIATAQLKPPPVAAVPQQNPAQVSIRSFSLHKADGTEIVCSVTRDGITPPVYRVASTDPSVFTVETLKICVRTLLSKEMVEKPQVEPFYTAAAPPFEERVGAVVCTLLTALAREQVYLFSTSNPVKVKGEDIESCITAVTEKEKAFKSNMIGPTIPMPIPKASTHTS